MKNYKWTIIFIIILIIISSDSINAQENNKITKINGKNSFDIGIKVSQIGWASGCDTVVILNEKSTIDGIISAPLANLYNAPVLLCSKDKISEEVSDEIKRLKPNNIIIIGGKDSISTKVELQLKNILPKIKLERIDGENRYDTCLLIADKISEKVDINRVYIGSGNGEPDLISIASKAGHDKQPILLSKKDSINEDIYKWMISKNLEDAYIIGGKNKISDKVIEDLNEITKSDIRNNRIYGKDRFETNSMVIEKFYKNSDMENLIIVDANDVNSAFQMAPLSSKLDCPLFLAPTKSLSESQLKILDYSNVIHIYRLGNSIDNGVFKEINAVEEQR